MKKVIAILIIVSLLFTSCSALTGQKPPPKVKPPTTPTLIERIKALESQQASLNLQISVANTQISDLKGKLSADEKNIADLKSTVTNLTDRIVRLETPKTIPK